MRSATQRKRKPWRVSRSDLGMTGCMTGGIMLAIFMVWVGVHCPANEPGRYFAFLYAALFLAAEVRGGRIRALLRRSDTLEQIAQRMRVEPAMLKKAARERDIEPRILYNGVPYYDPADLDDPSLLLRPADPPAGMLLRPASGGETSAEALLKPASKPTDMCK